MIQSRLSSLSRWLLLELCLFKILSHPHPHPYPHGRWTYEDDIRNAEAKNREITYGLGGLVRTQLEEFYFFIGPGPVMAPDILYTHEYPNQNQVFFVYR